MLRTLTPLTRRIHTTTIPLVHSTTRRAMLFEGNPIPAAASPEERMASIFGGRLAGEPPRATSRTAVGAGTMIAGVPVPARPQEPDNCCMSGCVNCVWETYSDDVRYWRAQRRRAAQALRGTAEVWPADRDPPLALLHPRNVPQSLRAQKAAADAAAASQPAVTPRAAVRALFPARETPLPARVIEASKRNHSHTEKRAERTAEDALADTDDGAWDGVPEHIRAFAEFERKKRLQKRRRNEERQRKIERRAPLRDALRARENEIARLNEQAREREIAAERAGTAEKSS